MSPVFLGIMIFISCFLFVMGIIILIYLKKDKKNIEESKNINKLKNSLYSSISFKNLEDDEYVNKVSNKRNNNRIIIGTIDINDKKENLSMQNTSNGVIYFLGGTVIGGYNSNVMDDNLIVFKENNLNNELSAQIKDQITQVIKNNSKIQNLEKEKYKIKENNFYEKEMGYQREIGENINKTQKKDEFKRDKDINKLNNKNNEKYINNIKDINIKQEIDMDTRVNDMDTIGKRLEEAGKIKGKEKEGKLAFVESDDLKKLKDENGNKLQGHSSRYEAVIIDKNGNVKSLGLENDTQEGTNPTERNYQIKQNKNSNIKNGDVLTRLKIQGQETIGIEKGQYGEVEIYHSHDKTIGGNGIEGNKSLDKQLETKDSKNPVEGMDEAVQKLSQKYQDGYRSVEDSYQEAKQHNDKKNEICEELQVEDLDGDLNTVSHSHTDDIVAELMKNGEISDKFTEREIRERVEREWNNKDEDVSKEEFQKNIEEDIEIDADNMHSERGR